MYTLYYAPGAASMAVHWVLLEVGAAHELKQVDLAAGEHRQPAYLALNPNGVVPTLLVHGAPVGEAAGLLLHLADAHPEAGLAPAPGSLARAQYYQWMFYLANTLQPAFRMWFYPAEAAGEGAVDEGKAQARRRIEACWDRLDRHLGAHGPHLLGETISAAEFMLTMLMRWSRNMPRPASEWPNLAALIKRMKARPTFATLYDREGLTDWA